MTNLDVIFIYAGDPNNTSINSPYTITRELHKALSVEFRKVYYYDWCHTGELPQVTKDTIILAHPNYPANTPAWRLFESEARLKCLIFPFHHAMPEINIPFDPLVQMADHVFSITGEYWYDTIDKTAFAHWKPKITRLDMAIDLSAFPYVRNRITGRDFAYIGCDRVEKGLHTLHDIFKGTDYKLHIYGNIDGANPLAQLPNVYHHGYATTIKEFGSDLCQSCVAFLNTSISDANPTTLIETAAWGLIVACTKGSGYHHNRENSLFWSLSDDDMNANRWLLNYLSTESEEILLARMQKVRAGIESQHNWGRFTSQVINKLLELI